MYQVSYMFTCLIGYLKSELSDNKIIWILSLTDFINFKIINFKFSAIWKAFGPDSFLGVLQLRELHNLI